MILAINTPIIENNILKSYALNSAIDYRFLDFYYVIWLQEKRG